MTFRIAGLYQATVRSIFNKAFGLTLTVNTLRGCRLAILIGLAWCSLLTCGCSPWGRDSKPPEPLILPANRMAPDAVGLELGVAQLDTMQATDLEQFWSQLDQQELPLEVRQQLDANGLRAAVMSSRPPMVFADLVYPREVVVEELDAFERALYIKGHLQPTSRMVLHDQVSNRQGQAHPVPTSEYHPAFSWIIHDRDAQTVGAGRQVRGVFSVTTFPQGDGSVKILITPEIHHGEARSRFGASEHGFKFESSQNVTPINALEFEVTLRSGESLVIAPTPDLQDLGRLFFCKPEGAGTGGQSMIPDAGLTMDDFDPLSFDADGLLANEASNAAQGPQPLHRMLLIRVVQTQMDDLFLDTQQTEPLTTARHD